MTRRTTFDLAWPDEWRGGLIVASPHSGRDYPDWFLRQTRLGEAQLRSSEDAFVDQLVAPALAAGAVTLVAGSCLLPILVAQLPVGFSPGEFIMPVADGAAQLQIASLILLVACALATFAGLWAGAPSPEPASTARTMVV